MDLVGKRVSVRHHGPDGVRDVVGRVLVADGDGIRIERRDGRQAFVPAGTVLAMRVVPDRPMRRRRAAAVSAEDLTRV
ncbi:hypothetical protein, partial [Aeromicrobium sp.]|uniref:hypothetical protein n=1 Tax=Aeromicrobium sp. TaxID=1871063 RepID=UPI0028A8209A